jgi:hypothetical protein
MVVSPFWMPIEVVTIPHPAVWIMRVSALVDENPNQQCQESDYHQIE